MNLLSTILVLLVSLEFLFIMYLETIATTSRQTSKVFGITIEKLKDKQVSLLLKNLGIYNGLVGLLLIYAVLFSSHPKELCVLVLTYIIIVAIYGGITSSINIFFKQATLPILALLSLLI